MQIIRDSLASLDLRIGTKCSQVCTHCRKGPESLQLFHPRQLLDSFVGILLFRVEFIPFSALKKSNGPSPVSLTLGTAISIK